MTVPSSNSNMSAPDGAVSVDAGVVIKNVEQIALKLIHDLAISQARVEALEAENAELSRQLRVRDAQALDVGALASGG